MRQADSRIGGHFRFEWVIDRFIFQMLVIIYLNGRQRSWILAFCDAWRPVIIAFDPSGAISKAMMRFQWRAR